MVYTQNEILSCWKRMRTISICCYEMSFRYTSKCKKQGREQYVLYDTISLRRRCAYVCMHVCTHVHVHAFLFCFYKKRTPTTMEAVVRRILGWLPIFIPPSPYALYFLLFLSVGWINWLTWCSPAGLKKE